jgi:hypothetical protein
MYKNEEEYFNIAVKTAISFLAAATLPAVIVACLLLLTYPPSTFLVGAFIFIVMFAFTFVIAAAHVLALGLPAFLFGLRLNAIHWWSALISAFVVGAAPFAILTWSDRSHEGWSKYIYDFSVWGLFGVSGGLVFWLLWRYWVRRDSPHTD